MSTERYLYLIQVVCDGDINFEMISMHNMREHYTVGDMIRLYDVIEEEKE